MEYMAKQPDKSFDLAVVDPPYGIGADKKNSTDAMQSKKSAANSKDYGDQEWDSAVPDLDYFVELMRISKHQIIWGVNYYNYPLFKGGRIYWDKCVTMPTYSDGEIAYCSKINSVRSYQFAWHGMIQGNIANKKQRRHPTQKPVALYKWLLKNYAEPGQRIIDTHLGSGSSAIAAHYFGCDFVGLEIDTDYFEAAKERFEKETRQLMLF
jgi:site-specific DNA-methyltransferase (adenine-specific)